jgi:hypothetical protein
MLGTIALWLGINCVVPVLSVPAAVGVARFMGVGRPLVEVIRDGQLYSCATPPWAPPAGRPAARWPVMRSPA